MEEGRTWKDFEKTCLTNDNYTSVFVAIIWKEGRVREEGNEAISWWGNCCKNEVPHINLRCAKNTPKAK